MKNAVTVLGVCLFAGFAFANSVTCSNAEGTLSYKYYHSNGGAFMERATLTYQGQTVSAFNGTGPHFEFNLSDEKIIDQTNQGPDASTTVSVARAAGSLQSNGQNLSFSELVLCKREQVPDCRMCP